MKIILEKVKEEEKELFFRLLQYSLFEESKYDGNEMNKEGCFEYKDFDDYLIDNQKTSYFIKEEESKKLCGFIMIDKNKKYKIVEFMIIPKYRRQQIGKEAAIKCFNMYKGEWEIEPSLGSKEAYTFWKKVIDEYTNNQNEYKDGRFHFHNSMI